MKQPALMERGTMVVEPRLWLVRFECRRNGMYNEEERVQGVVRAWSPKEALRLLLDAYGIKREEYTHTSWEYTWLNNRGPEGVLYSLRVGDDIPRIGSKSDVGGG